MSKASTKLLKALEWCGVAYGAYGSTARMCRVCGGIHKKDSLNMGGGNYEQGHGHKKDCELKAAIRKDG